MKTSNALCCAAFLIAGFMAAVPGYAQNITGSLSGRVIDGQGAVVANASVAVSEPTKNVTTTQKSGAGGEFSIAGLLPGTYSLSVEAAGFKKLSRTGIVLNANDKLGVGDIALEVGAVTESVEVSAEASVLQTESVERSATISSKQIENIEVNGRNPLDMAKLIPGVSFTTGTSYAVGNSGTGANTFTVNGARPSQNQLTLNGIGNVDTGNNGGMNVSVSTDSIAEFKILTGSYQAEFGRSVGAQISVVTKSGTDDFHGTGYWYHRHDSLNANTFLNNARPSFGQAFLPRPLFRYNDPGYTIGGPIWIPKILDKTRHKGFFFFSQEFQRQLVPNAAKNVQVPTALARKGDFSDSRDNNGQLLTSIRDPQSGAPFPNLVIPIDRIYAPGQAVLNLMPLPNTAQSGNFNYSSQLPGASPRRETLLRVDYNITPNLRAFGHWVDNQQPTVAPYGSFVLGINLPLTTIQNPIPGRSIAAGATWVISPTMTNEANWGFTHNSILIDQTGDDLTRTKTGINLPLLYPGALQKDYIPNLQFNGTRINAQPTFGTQDAPFVNYNTTIDLSDNLTKVSGRHVFKAGVYLQRSRKDQTSFAAANGQYNFGDSPSNPFDTGFGYANALLGVYNTFQQASAYINGQYRYWNIEEFVQDTWKIKPRLTLDFGMRGAWYQPQYDSSLQASTFIPNLYDPSKAVRLYQPAQNPAAGNARQAYDPVANIFLPAYDIGLEIPGSGLPFQGMCQGGGCVSKYLFKNRKEQWGPRFGFAWDVTGEQKIVIRSGAGIYYDRIQGNRIFDSVSNPPEAVTPVLNQNYASTIDPKNVLLAPPAVNMADPTGKIPTTYQYQFSVQYRLPWDIALDTAYVGSMSRHQQDNRNLNYNAFGQCFLPQNQDPALQATNPTALLGNNCLPAVFLKPIQGYGNINLYESQATSNYNALQIQAQRRAAKGLFLGVSYSWSKVMATALSGSGTITGQTLLSPTNDNSFVRPDGYNQQANHAPATFDRRQNLAINYVYQTPRFKTGNALTRLVTDGWQLSGVTQILTGSPFTPLFNISGANNQNITGSNSEAARIGVVKGCDPYTHSGDPFNALNASCFFAPSPGSLGLESGINFLYGPKVVNFDMSLQKEFALAKESKAKLQLRVDAFNAFNHPQFSGYNLTLNYNAYPQTNGIVTGLPTLSSTALGRNPNGSLNFTGFGTATQTGAGALGYARVLQTVIRVTF
jgi:hypothetical protein